MSDTYVYDKSKYHHQTVQECGLSLDHASNHSLFFLRWLVEQDLMSEFFVEESGGVLTDFKAGLTDIRAVYEHWDCCLIDEMLSEQGNGFAMSYFDFEKGGYIRDLQNTLQRNLPSEYHIEYTEANYLALKRVIDKRYQDWSAPAQSRRWWPFSKRPR